MIWTDGLASARNNALFFLAYEVSDLQQKVTEATVGNLVHANKVLSLAKRCVQQDQKLRFLDLGIDCRLGLQHGHSKSRRPLEDDELGFAAHRILASALVSIFSSVLF